MTKTTNKKQKKQVELLLTAATEKSPMDETYQPEIFTDKEAANFLRISQVTLWRERKKGRISFHRSASKIIYTRADLQNYLESTKRDAFATLGGRNEK